MAIARERWSDVKVGIFVLVALAILIAGSLWIAGGSLFGARQVPYDVLLADSGGVVAGRPRADRRGRGRADATT